ncbi:MAG: HpcH/HpaI aldolase/citrate lyase family protein [Phenylobacterium sp.]
MFVPGDAPAKMEKALHSQADALILDLEDSVVEARKAEARAEVRAFLKSYGGQGGPELWVRVNSTATRHILQDLVAVVDVRPFGIVLPKADSVLDVQTLEGKLTALEQGSGGPIGGGIRILPIVTETPGALFQFSGYHQGTTRLAGLTWGAEDLCTAVGAVTPRDEDGRYTTLYEIARALTLAASAAAGVPAIETIVPDFRDLDAILAYATRGRRDGFVGMMAIHPAQVPIINQAFSPSDAEIDFARHVVALFAANPNAGALSLGGKMVDAPHLKQALHTLGRIRSLDV